MSYYMSSWITSEYMDHEVFKVLKHSGSITKLPSPQAGHHWAT
jgi:hypothetical protein